MVVQVKGLQIQQDEKGYWLIFHGTTNRLLIRTTSREQAEQVIAKLGSFAKWDVEADVVDYLMHTRPDLYERYEKIRANFHVEASENYGCEQTKDARGVIRYYVIEDDRKRYVQGISLGNGLAVHQEPNDAWTIDHLASATMLSECSTMDNALAVAKKMDGLIAWRKMNAPDVLLRCESMRQYLTNTRKKAEAGKPLMDAPEELGYELMFMQSEHLQDKWLIFLDAWQALNQLVGLDQVKEEIRELLAVERGRLRQGDIQNGKSSSMHMLFMGPPGTGKTEVARIIGKFYYALGYLQHDGVKEVLRADIVGNVIGETERKFKEIIEESMGGVLFIDEAYALANGGQNDFGREAVNLLIAEMENRRDDFMVILAGYTNDMEELMAMNAGFRSRIPNKIHFYNYTPEELTEIAMNMLTKTGYVCQSGVRSSLRKYVEKEAKQGVLEGNARTVRHLVEEVYKQQYIRVGRSNEDNLRKIILIEDIEQLIRPTKSLQDEKGLEEMRKQATQELEAMVGMDTLKEEIRQIVIQAQMSKRREELGFGTKKARHHMVFSGPAGTGKTTVAKIIGKFFNGLGILSSGHFKKVNRADLVGEYQGHTAKKVQRVINEAKGGILFIDEAYMLVNGPNDNYGYEAVGMLIDLMEEYKDDLVVILAGYEADIQQLLQTNEGFTSRIGHTFVFPSYSVQNIIAITLMYLRKEQFHVSEEVEATIAREIQAIANQTNGQLAGNGRWAEEFSNDIRNALDFRIYQAEKKGETVTKEDLMTIIPKDIVWAANTHK